MITDTEIKRKGVRDLLEALGELETERFISLMTREPVDYTKWQGELWEGKTVAEISGAAMAFRREVDSGGKK